MSRAILSDRNEPTCQKSKTFKVSKVIVPTEANSCLEDFNNDIETAT